MAGSGSSGRSKRKRAKASAAAPVALTDATPPADLEDLVMRYHAMAEELNGRGAMELAVPFYRQAITLLLTEREQWQRQTGAAPVGGVVQSLDPVREAVHGVLEAAASAGLPAVELERQLAALEDSLTPHNLREGAAALADLEQRWGQPHAGISALAARLALLAGDLAGAHQHYERALDLDSADHRIALNAGAARLAVGDPAGAAELLRPLTARTDELDQPTHVRALWKNLARAEHELGDVRAAVVAVRSLLELAPDAVEAQPWLEASRDWIAAGQAEAALQLLEALRAAVPAPELILPQLAEALEAVGRYRDAALVYRELLRPGLQAPQAP